MKKILASDIDGTLVIDNEIRQTTLEGIKALKAKGYHFVLCTGRDFDNTKAIFLKYQLEIDGLVLCNGALVLDKNLKPYYEKGIDEKIVKEIYDTFTPLEGYYLGLGNGYETYIDKWPEGIDKMNFKIHKVAPSEIAMRFPEIKLISVIATGKDISEVEAIKNKLNDKYGDYIVAYRNQVYIDIVPVGCSKAMGIEKIANQLKSHEEDVYVIGDSWNDLSMFEKYKHSFTFDYAEEALKGYTKHTVKHIDDCIKHIIES